jgi:hypothetical protein
VNIAALLLLDALTDIHAHLGVLRRQRQHAAYRGQPTDALDKEEAAERDRLAVLEAECRGHGVEPKVDRLEVAKRAESEWRRYMRREEPIKIGPEDLAEFLEFVRRYGGKLGP